MNGQTEPIVKGFNAMQVTFPPGTLYPELYVPNTRQRRAIEHFVRGRGHKALQMLYDVSDLAPLQALAAVRPCYAAGWTLLARNMEIAAISAAKRCGLRGITYKHLRAGVYPPPQLEADMQLNPGQYAQLPLYASNERLPTYEEACAVRTQH